MTPRGYDPDRDQCSCPECGADLDIDWIESRGLGQRTPRYMPGRISCPRGRTHDLTAAHRTLFLVEVAHPDRDEPGQCSLLSLPFWREQGWYPTDPEFQTPTEMVHARVRELTLGR
jgi:hypothetical protein